MIPRLKWLPALALVWAAPALAAPIATYPQASTPLSGSEGLIGTQNTLTVQFTPQQLQGYALRANALSLWDYLTPAQQTDVRNRTETLDVTSAVQAWVAATIAQKRNGYVPDGTYKISAAPIVIDLGSIGSNGLTYFGDNDATTIFDFRTNSSNPPFVLEATGGSVGAPKSEVYGSILGISFMGNVAGPVLQIGQNDFSDAINQGRFNISVQNFSTSSSSTCGKLNYVLSSTGFMNCSTSAGPAGGNDAWQFEQVQFGNWTLGGSNAQNWLHMTNGSNAGNFFAAMDCEIVAVCVKIDSSGSVNNMFGAGTWNYSTNGVVETAGGNNHAFVPSINGVSGNFLSGGSSTYFFRWDNASLTPLASPTFSGAVSINNPAANVNLNLTSGAATASVTEDLAAGNLHINNTNAGAFTVLEQTGSGTQQWKVNSADLMDLTSSGLTVKTAITANSGLTAASGSSVVAPYFRPTLTTVAGLSTVDPTPQAGDHAAVSDASACTANATPTGGGAVTCAVTYSGAAWKATVTH